MAAKLFDSFELLSPLAFVRRPHPGVLRLKATSSMPPETPSCTGPSTTSPRSSACRTAHGQPEDHAPTLIVICTWMGAQMSVVRRYYVEPYRKLYPSSSQVVVEVDLARLWKPQAILEKGYEPHVRQIEAHLTSRNQGPPPRVLFHVISIGGVSAFSDLASALRTRNVQAPENTQCAIIFDSAPAPLTLTVMRRASTAGISSPLNKALIQAAISLVFLATVRVHALAGIPAPMVRELARLDDPDFTLFPWSRTPREIPRLYLYSRKDAIVHAEDVEKQVARARAAGFPVRTVSFERSGHVAHARDEPERYWDAVETFWREEARFRARL